MRLKEFLAFSRRKIVISLLLPLLWAILAFVLEFFVDLFRPEDVPPIFTPVGVEPSISIMALIIGYLLSAIFSYPFSCLLVYLYDEKKKKGFMKILTAKNVLLFALFAIIFNPFTLTIILGVLAIIIFLVLPQGTPCAIEIVYVLEGSPTDNAGLTEGEILISINNTTLGDDLEKFFEYMMNSSPGEIVFLETDKGTYEVTLGEHPEADHGFLGFVVDVAYCR